jgi:hypothetical protein
MMCFLLLALYVALGLLWVGGQFYQLGFAPLGLVIMFCCLIPVWPIAAVVFAILDWLVEKKEPILWRRRP